MKDKLLMIIIGIAENMRKSPGGAKQAITLNVGGLMISGNLLSQKQYLELFLHGAIQEIIDKAKASGKLSPADGVDDDPTDYIHLETVKFWLPGTPFTAMNSPLWRGPVAAVNGFSLGEPQVLKS